MTVRIIIGDAREKLAELGDESVQCCVTSPPYFGLRDYDDPHQIGMEPTPLEFVAALVSVFREVRRVLRSDGTLWLNLGDSYNSHDPGGYREGEFLNPGGRQSEASKGARNKAGTHVPGLKRKDLIGIPWRVAFALQADGWYLRQDIIWSKPNPMPESVTDRCTKSHEYLFLLTKSPQYHYDAEAIKENLTDTTVARLNQPTLAQQAGSMRVPGKTNGPMKAVGGRRRGVPPRHQPYPGSDQSGLDAVCRGNGRNKRSVWTVATQPYSGAHFATFPPALVEPCILAGSPIRSLVLDPFAGTGTVGMVSDRLGRDAVLIEINRRYADLAAARIRARSGYVDGVEHAKPIDLPLFGGGEP